MRRCTSFVFGLSVTLIALGALCGCQGSPAVSEDVGTAGAMCYGNGTCNEGLKCKRGTCVVSGEKSSGEKTRKKSKKKSKKKRGSERDEAALGAAMEKLVVPALEEKKAELGMVVESWARAQCNGDFQAYSALYGAGFQGIKRTSKGTTGYGRQGWLQDRRRMFDKPQRVIAQGVEVTLTQAGADVRFEQFWESRTYSDRGSKVMSLAQQNGAWKIVREEMLNSNPWGGGELREGGGSLPLLGAVVAYRARLGHRDHVNEACITNAGVCRVQKTIDNIIYLDRVHFHKGIRDAGDHFERHFNVQSNRRRLQELLRSAPLSDREKLIILQRTPLVEVRMYSNHATVKIIDVGVPFNMNLIGSR